MAQDFTGQNLQGRSFRGQNLVGANFSYADIRGADFSGADLTRANFSHARAGLKPKSAIYITFIAFVLVITSAISSAVIGLIAVSPFVGGFTQDFFIFPTIHFHELTKIFPLIPLPGIAAFFILFAYFFSTFLRQGFKPALRTITYTAICCPLLIIFVLLLLTPLLLILVELGALAGWKEIFELIAVYLLFSAASIATGSLLVTFSEAIFFASTLAYGVAVNAVERVSGRNFTIAALYTYGFSAIFATILSSWETASIIIRARAKAGLLALLEVIIVAASVTLIASLFAGYIGWKALKSDKKYFLICKMTAIFSTNGSTSFRTANLTETNFAGTLLKNTDLRAATMSCATWSQSRQLSWARVSQTYLANTQLQRLLVTGEGQRQSFNSQDLRNLNLRETNLADASLIGTDLYQTDLRKATLSGAKLVRANLEAADLSEACLTGACIQDWSITQSTQFVGTICKYVYLKLPGEDGTDVQRLPHQREFKAGEFSQFVRSLLDTLTLEHDRSLDANAALQALKSLTAGRQDALSVVALEHRNDRILIKVKLPVTANRDRIKQQYFERYDRLVNVAPEPSSYQGEATALFADLIQQTQHKKINIYLYNYGVRIAAEEVKLTLDRSLHQTVTTAGGNLVIDGAGAFSLGDITGTVVNQMEAS